LVDLRGMSEEDARARMAAQASRADRLAVADLVIDNDGPLDGLEPQVREVWRKLRDYAPRSD
jgi:dephospho-CoA kinase